MPRRAGQYLNNRLVVDQTELKGSYDFTLRYTPKIPAGIATTGEQIPLFDALEKQLGLKLGTDHDADADHRRRQASTRSRPRILPRR